jgi:DNA-binding transcriptional LysR family regulator
LPRDPRLAWQVLAEDHMAAAVPAGHPLAAAEEIPLAALADEDWVTPHPSACRDALELACRQAGFAPAVVSETNDYLAMLGLVAAGVGVAVVPRLVAASPVPAGVALRPLVANRLRRVVAVVTSPNGHRPPIQHTMLQLFQSMVGGLSHPDLPLTGPA